MKTPPRYTRAMPQTQGFIVTRFAPSPTGHLHVGGARTALFCWAFAKSQRDSAGRPGRFMIRIEDTDQARSSDESARGILEDLAWLGITWDDGPEWRAEDGRVIGGDERGVGPYFQARRVGLYNEQLEKMVRLGRAYPAFESAEELEARRREAVAAKRTYRYQRPADVQFGVFNEERWRRACAGEPHVVRFVAPNEEIVVHDQVLGDVRYAAGEMDDFVIRKADGFPTYHFAVVVDDEFMGVTHVLRAQEHLNNTPRHVAMQRALGYRTPVYAHMPLIFNMDGTKMSKRDKAKAARQALQQRLSQDKTLSPAAVASRLGLDPALLSGFVAKENDSLEVAGKIAAEFGIALPEIEVCDFREAGYIPEAITNFLALLGWNPGMKTEDGKDLERFDLAFMAQHFSLDRIGTGNARFDRAKLLAFNASYIAGFSDDEFVRRWREWAGRYAPRLVERLSEAQMLMLAPVIKPRARTLRDAGRTVEFALVADEAIAYDPKAVEKNLKANGGAGLAVLRDFRAALAELSDWSPTGIHAFVEEFARGRGFVNEKGVNVGPVAQPLRVALTGSAISPPLGETLALLGRDATIRRIDRCLASVG